MMDRLQTLFLEEGDFFCFCTVELLDDGAWVGSVLFESKREHAARQARVAAFGHSVPGTFSDRDSAMSATTAYALRTVERDEVNL